MDQRTERPGTGVLASLGRAWREHRPYVAFAVVVFAAGTALGVGLDASGVDLFAVLGIDIGPGGGVFPDRLTVWTILLNNSRAFLVFLLGALTLGLLTAFGLVVNGVLLGYVGAVATGERGLAFVVLAIAPHGVLELPALFVVAGVAFRLVHRAGARVLGRRETVLDRSEWRRTAALVAVAWLALAVAAVIEVELTFRLVRALG